MDSLAADWISLKPIIIAACLGAILGIEREIAGKPAGVRTHIFVCAGSALMMILGQEIIDQFQEQETSSVLSTDPIRVLQAIVVGISFLGAGTIVHDSKEGVAGLTTAATIYLTAGIGVAVAVDRMALAVVITIFAVLVLVIVGWIEVSVERWRAQKT
ncbi:MAG TPA: MgtC/SapB family protein [Nitrospira sp.]|nr:MgtC/SapB family protein [Nitrospira sp.]